MFRVIAIVSIIIAALTVGSVAWIFWLLYSRERPGEWVDGSFSPDGGIAAQVFEYASGSYSRYEIALRDRRAAWKFSTIAATLDNAKLSECAAGVHLRWQSPEVLVVEYFT